MPTSTQIAILSPRDVSDPSKKFVSQFDGESLKLGSFLGGQEILRGVGQFARTQDHWNLYYAENPIHELERYIDQVRPHGIITGVTSPAYKQILERSGAVVVNYGTDMTDPGFPSVYEDNRALGRLGAKHFLERRLQRAVYVGYPGTPYSDSREQGFIQTFEKKGNVLPSYVPADSTSPTLLFSPSNPEFCAWLSGLVKPVGILCCVDRLALNIAATCRALKIRVPEDVSLLGIDNQEIVCELSRPPLSSVSFSRAKIGFMAAKLLHRLLNGKAAPSMSRLIPPDGVVNRQSSDVFAIDDEYLLSAMKLIHEHALSGISVEDLFSTMPISRRQIEKKFRKKLNKTPQDELLRVRLDRAKQLLTSTDQTLTEIAHGSGFHNNIRLALLFKKKEGITPGEFRRRSRK